MPHLYGLPGEETDAERMINRMIEESIIYDSDPEFLPRTLRLNGKPFKVELGPRLIRFYEGAVIGCQVFPWPDFFRMVRLILIGEKRVLCIDLGFRPEGVPFPARITANPKKGTGRIWFEDGQTQEIRDFEIEETSIENRTAIDFARTRRLIANHVPAVLPVNAERETAMVAGSVLEGEPCEPMPERPSWGISDEGATLRVYTPDGDFTLKNSVGNRQIVWMFRHAAEGRPCDISRLYSETQGRAEHTAALPDFTTEDRGGDEQHESGDVQASGTLNVDAQMDVQTMRQVKERLHELSRERTQAQAENNDAALARIDKEVDDLKRYLTTGCGLKGKPRVFSNDLSKRIATVKKAVKRAIEDIDHKRDNRAARNTFTREAKLITLGLTCSYRPSGGIEWVDVRK